MTAIGLDSSMGNDQLRDEDVKKGNRRKIPTRPLHDLIVMEPERD